MILPVRGATTAWRQRHMEYNSTLALETIKDLRFGWVLIGGERLKEGACGW